MASFGQVRISLIRELLEKCAPDHDWTEKPHHYRVTWNGKTYPSLPKGSHGTRGRRANRAEIELGHVKKMVRFLEIDIDCANDVIPQLNLKPS